MNNYSEFSKIYSLTKTLRFGLIPQGKTLKYVEKNGIIKEGERKEKCYKIVKKLIDEYHKFFISKSLRGIVLNDLDEYEQAYVNKNSLLRIKSQNRLRKEIVARFSGEDCSEIFKDMFTKKIISGDKKEKCLLYKSDWRDSDFTEEEKKSIEEFKGFTTYFTGFWENRKNMYSDEEQVTAIAYRIIHENLPKFIDNRQLWDKIKHQNCQPDFLSIPMELGEELHKLFSLFSQNKQESLDGIELLEKVFELHSFNSTLTQSGIDLYNTLIGGKTDKQGQKIQGLNEKINLFNQKIDKTNRLPRFKQLYKQILSDREAISFLPESFENDKEMLDAINSYYKNSLSILEVDNKIVNVLDEIEKLLLNLKEYDLEHIYLQPCKSLQLISVHLFGDYDFISKAVDRWHSIQNMNIKKKNSLITKQEASILEKSYSIATLEKIIRSYIDILDEAPVAKEKFEEAGFLARYFEDYCYQCDEHKKLTKNSLFYSIKSNYKGLEGLLNIEDKDAEICQKKLARDEVQVKKIKAFLDRIIDLLHFIKPLSIKANQVDQDMLFYNSFTAYYEVLNEVLMLYDKVRNYLTQKPYNISKVKLNFNVGTFLNGWSQSKEKDNLGIILRKGRNFYLGIMDRGNNSNKSFENLEQFEGGDEFFYEKMVYKLLPSPHKMLPKVFFPKKLVRDSPPSARIKDIFINKTYKNNRDDLYLLIDFYKKSIELREDWCKFNFEFSETSSYENIAAFFHEIEQQNYKLEWQKISIKYIDNLVDSGKLYLFQIHSKDFSPHSTGRSNLHTLYWESLYSPENSIYKLNGEAEVFFRRASINETDIVKHSANKPIVLKNPLTPAKNSTFPYELVKDKRFTVDKFQFHVPITLNYKAPKKANLNTRVMSFLKDNSDVTLLGIDRGERNLLYLVLMNQAGDIILQETLNTIVDESHQIETPYHQLLDAKENQRDSARKSWSCIESIKELKEGYLSQVVSRITQLIVKHNAIVILEDLNFGFKRGRFKVEKQVYQKFEKKLIDKLNYLVFKQNDKNSLGGTLNAYQLTDKFESFKALKKQSGILFYVPAWHTSKIDPTTGFVNFLKPKYENLKQAKDFFNTFDFIRFNQSNNYFEFGIDYNKFPKAIEETRMEWTICTHGAERHYFDKEKRQISCVDVTEKCKTLFQQYKIDFNSGEELKDLIASINEKSFFISLMNYLDITLLLRYSSANKDYILSPVENSKGEFYDSVKEKSNLPFNADANGAYHIALKGLMILNQINGTDGDQLDKMKFDLSHKTWLQFIQAQNFLF